ncbi:UNVERIFIED_ORG: hypothetical protein GGE11_001618 [Mycolicibacterium obuense]|uniref:Uncharacterized protein n=2 Tax=unclassified Mycobacterium TaxID=2642494 RepID=A0A5Q5BFK3_MYCSS
MSPQGDGARPIELNDALYERIRAVAETNHEIPTLSVKRPNWIVAVERKGVWVETERSRALGSGPQLVPAWMIDVGWKRLCAKGSMTQDELLDALNVKRSAFVCALLAQFPDVSVSQTRPTILELVGARGAN